MTRHTALVAIRPACGHKVYAIPEGWACRKSNIRELERCEAIGLRVDVMSVKAALDTPWCPLDCPARRGDQVSEELFV